MDENQVVTHSEMSTICYSTKGWSLHCTRDRWHSKAWCTGAEPPRCQQDLTERQWGFQGKGKYGQVCNKKREGSCLCVTGPSLKIFGELMAESSLWHLQLAEPSGGTGQGSTQAVQLCGTHTAFWARAGWAAAQIPNSDLPSFGSSPVQLSTPWCILWHL